MCAAQQEKPTLRRRAGNVGKHRLETQKSPAAAGKILPFGRSKLRCPTCDGTGSISLDIQFLPDVEIVCPDCGGSRYCREASMVARERKDGVRQTLLSVFQRLIASGATVLVIEHDLDLIRNADFVIDMGPGGGNDGGRIVVSGTPEEVRRCKQSVTGHYI